MAQVWLSLTLCFFKRYLPLSLSLYYLLQIWTSYVPANFSGWYARVYPITCVLKYGKYAQVTFQEHFVYVLIFIFLKQNRFYLQAVGLQPAPKAKRQSGQCTPTWRERCYYREGTVFLWGTVAKVWGEEIVGHKRDWKGSWTLVQSSVLSFSRTRRRWCLHQFITAVRKH